MHDKIEYLAIWAFKFKCEFRDNGEVGFGRPCVGMIRDNHYLDYSHIYNEYPNEEFWTPEDAYHKHSCMAVLGHGDEAVEQLYQWAKWLEENDWTTDDILRTPTDEIDAMIHGMSIPRLIKKVK